MNAANEYVPDENESGVFDPAASRASAHGEENPQQAKGAARPEHSGRDKPNARPPCVEFLTPSQILRYLEPPNYTLAGDYHIRREGFSVLAGPPGCGKSRAALALALMGARGSGDWLGSRVKCRFRTLIIQSENGRVRLWRDFQQLPDAAELDDWIRVSPPPPAGMPFNSPEFRAAVTKELEQFQPDLIVIDPWNAVTRDSMEKDFLEAFNQVRETIAQAGIQPAVLIVHHLRKRKSDDTHKGRRLADLMAGSYIMQSAPRFVIVLQPATDDPADRRVIATPVKCSDGDPGERTAWLIHSGRLEPVTDFDWGTYDSGESLGPVGKVKKNHIEQLLGNGKAMALNAAVKDLVKISGAGRTACYNALQATGRFKGILVIRDGVIRLADPLDERGDGLAQT